MRTFRIFLIPTLLSLTGFFLTFSAIFRNQNIYILSCGLVLIFISVTIILNAYNKISNKTNQFITYIFVIIAFLFTFFIYKSISEPIEFQKQKRYIYSHVIQRLKDIREVQIAYKKEYGIYANVFDTLINFLKFDSVKVLKMFGSIPDSLSELEAIEKGIIKKEITLLPSFENIFDSAYMENRISGVSLNPDSICYVPFGNGTKFKLKAKKINQNNIEVPVFEVSDPNPFDPDNPMIVGSVTDIRTSGNWKEEK